MKDVNFLVKHPYFTNEYTNVFSESPDVMEYNAPHHFHVRDAKTDKVLSEVHFQEGPIKEVGVNGVCNEDLLLMVYARLDCFQHSDYMCTENEEAMRHIEEAVKALRSRTNRRKAAGIEGTSATDNSVSEEGKNE